MRAAAPGGGRAGQRYRRADARGRTVLVPRHSARTARHAQLRRSCGGANLAGIVLATVADFVTNRCAQELWRRLDIASTCCWAFRRRQVPALDVYVPGLVVWRRRRRRGAAGRRQLGVTSRVRAAAGRRDGRFGVAPGPALGPCAVRATGIGTGDFPDRRSASANRRPYCSVICAWSGRSRCCGKAASTGGARPGMAAIRRDAHRTRGRAVRRPRQ